MKKLDLTWEQFRELRLLCEAIGHSKDLGVGEGNIKNTIVTSTWDNSGVEIKLDLDE